MRIVLARYTRENNPLGPSPAAEAEGARPYLRSSYRASALPQREMQRELLSLLEKAKGIVTAGSVRMRCASE